MCRQKGAAYVSTSQEVSWTVLAERLILRVNVGDEVRVRAILMPSALDKHVGLRKICRDLVVLIGHGASDVGMC